MGFYYKIVIWNANGLTNHIQEIKTFLYTNDIDILLISETHFTSRSYIKIANYDVYHTMHPDGVAHGGSAILIKNKIKHHVGTTYQKDYIQATTIVLEDWTASTNITAVYCPPKYKITAEQFENFVSTLGQRFIAGGDYNAKHPQWGSRLTSPRGRTLYKILEKYHLETIATGEPTYWPSDTNKIPDAIDFAIIKGISKNKIRTESCLELSSDHSPIILEVSQNILVKDKPPKLHNKYTKWDRFREEVLNNVNLKRSLKTHDDIIEAVEHFNQCVQQAAWNATPAIVDRTNEIYCSKVIRDTIKEKRKLRKNWQSTRHPEDKTKLNKATKELKRLLHQEQNFRLQQYLKNLTATDTTDYSLWKILCKLNKPQFSYPPIRKLDNTWAKTDSEKADTFASHLSTVFKPNTGPINLNEDEHIFQKLNETHQMEPPIKGFTKNETRNIIFNYLNPKKAPGYDLITGRVLRELPEHGLVYLTQLYNAVLRTSFYPPQWKVAEIIMIVKPGKKPEHTASYRPISLLPIVAKVFEKLLLLRLKPIIENLHLIPKHQFGFRQHHSTIQQVHRIVNKIHKSFESGSYCTAAFLDIAQAFDKVWHDGLLYKLKIALPANYYTILKSYVQNRQFYVKQGQTRTTLHEIHAGVPQGSVLGPILYLLYTADLPTIPGTLTATFADDTAIAVEHRDPAIASELLQQNLSKIEMWLKRWRIKVNETKSVQVTFTLRRETCPQVTINGTPIEQTQEAKYLGIHLDRRLTWRKHIFTKRKQLGLKSRKMYWMLGRNSRLTLENKLLIYTSTIRPIWSYGCQLWGAAANTNVDILQRYQSKMLRTIADAPWYVTNEILHRDLKIPTVKELIGSCSSKYRDKLHFHPNAWATVLMKKKEQPSRLKRRFPQDLA